MPSELECEIEIQTYTDIAALIPLLVDIEFNLRMRKEGTKDQQRKLTFRSDGNLEWEAGYAWQYLIPHAFSFAEKSFVRYHYPVPMAMLRSGWTNDAFEKLDGYVEFPDWPIACVLEAKDHKRAQGADPIVKLRAGLSRRPAHTIGCLFTTSGTTEVADLALMFEPSPTILVWELSHVRACLERGPNGMREGLQRKIRYAALYGMNNAPIDFDVDLDEI